MEFNEVAVTRKASVNMPQDRWQRRISKQASLCHGGTELEEFPDSTVSCHYIFDHAAGYEAGRSGSL